MISARRSADSSDIPLLISELRRATRQRSGKGRSRCSTTGKGASQKPPERQVFPVAPVYRIAVGNEDPETIDRKFSPFRIDIEPEPSGKIVFQKEIVVSLTEAYPDPLTLQGRYPLHHRSKTGIDDIPPCEPEIEEVTGNDKMIHREPLIGFCAAVGCSPSPEPFEKSDEPEVGGIGGTLEVCVREKDRLHTGTPGGTISLETALVLSIKVSCP